MADTVLPFRRRVVRLDPAVLRALELVARHESLTVAELIEHAVFHLVGCPSATGPIEPEPSGLLDPLPRGRVIPLKPKRPGGASA